MLAKRRSTKLHSSDELDDLVAFERNKLGFHSRGDIINLGSPYIQSADVDLGALGEDAEGITVILVNSHVTSIEDLKKLWAPNGLADGAVECDDVVGM